MISVEKREQLYTRVKRLKEMGYSPSAMYSEFYAKGYSADDIHAALDYHLYHEVRRRISATFLFIALIVIIIGALLLMLK